ncbi:MAG: tetratricopeptide repeat protein [Acidobacteria bacterium]|nr:tetratricopeptide repeat protein [Acidobacteriota bacterium]
MKRCPQCGREYDASMMFCLDDGAELLYGPATGRSEPPASAGGQFGVEPQTAILSEPPAVAGGLTGATDETDVKTAILQPPGSGTDDVPVLRTSPATAAGGSDRRAKPLIAALAVVVLLLGGFFGYRYFNQSGGGQINSIAVLPFENRSGSGDTEYLSDGLADSLIYRLAQLPNLKVSPTSSVMRYKGSATDVARIAEELDVDAVMSGRLSQRGDDLSISVQLIDSRTKKLIWAEQYDRKMTDLLATQREIATTITQKLQLQLSGESEQKLAKKYTNNDEAYQLYLRGQYHLARRSKDDLLKAIEYYEQAIKLDPDFALAYVGMSYAYSSGIGNSFLPVSYEEGISRAKNAAVRAGEIDPNLAEAHSAMGTAFRLEWKWPEAERALKKALEIDPNNASAHYFYGLYLQSVGRTGDAVREIKMAVDLEPMSLIMQANLGGAYLFDRQSQLGLDQAKRTFDLDPNFISGRFWLAYAYTVNQKFAEAIELMESAPIDEVSQRLLARFRGYAYAKSGRRSEAEAILNKYRSDPEFSAQSAAMIYGALGEKDKAFAALDIGFTRKQDMARMKVDPLFDDLRDDPRFAALLKRMGLPE